MIIYENGVKKHVKRLKAPKRMQATDVVPGKLYLARLSFSTWSLVNVQCAKEPGWLRGFVNVRGFSTRGFGEYRAWVTVEDFNSGKHYDMPVYRRRFEEPWTFVDGRDGTLMEPPDGYIQNQIDTLVAQVRARQAEHDQYYMETLAAVRRFAEAASASHESIKL